MLGLDLIALHVWQEEEIKSFGSVAGNKQIYNHSFSERSWEAIF